MTGSPSASGATPLAAVERALCDFFGHRPQRASVSFVGVEPIEVLRFAADPVRRVYASLGMSRHPMTAAAAAVTAADGPRAELLLELNDPADAFADLWRRLAILAAAPAVEGVVYRPGMTVEVGEALAPGSRCVGGVVSPSAVPAVATESGPVELLQIVPATSTELAFCRVQGTDALRELWRAQRVDLLDLARGGAALS